MIKIFFDTSVLIAGLISSEGGSAKIISFCEAGILEGWISGQVLDEISRVIKRKIPSLPALF